MSSFFFQEVTSLASMPCFCPSKVTSVSTDRPEVFSSPQSRWTWFTPPLPLSSSRDHDSLYPNWRNESPPITARRPPLFFLGSFFPRTVRPRPCRRSLFSVEFSVMKAPPFQVGTRRKQYSSLFLFFPSWCRGCMSHHSGFFSLCIAASFLFFFPHRRVCSVVLVRTELFFWIRNDRTPFLPPHLPPFLKRRRPTLSPSHRRSNSFPLARNRRPPPFLFLRSQFRSFSSRGFFPAGPVSS